MAINFDQRWIVTAGVAAGGALAALAASDAVPPQVAAYSAIGVLLLSMFGVHAAPAPEKKVLRQSDQILFHPKDEPAPPEPPAGTSGRTGLP